MKKPIIGLQIAKNDKLGKLNFNFGSLGRFSLKLNEATY